MKKQESKNREKSSKTWHEILEGGVPGILLGVGGTIAVENLYGKGPMPVGIPVAHTSTDEMSFSEALDAARTEVGPGGAFCWHGRVFSTYRVEDPEWIALGPEGQAAHCHEILEQVHAEPYVAPVHEPVGTPSQEEGPVETTDQGEGPVETPVHDHGEGPVETLDHDEESVGTPPHDEGPAPIESDVHITEIREDLESNEVAAIGEVDGVATVFIDEDGDGNVDIVLHDDDGNGHFDESEMYSAEGTGITIGELAQEMDHGQDVDLVEDQPDYSNEVSYTDYDNTANVEGF